MCGIIGLLDHSNNLSIEEKRTYTRAALYADTVRGTDSSGFMASSFEQYETKHSLTKGTRLQDSFFTPIKDDTSTIIAHNRAATIGGSVLSAAHPFTVEEKLIGVHNGTLDHGWEGIIGDDYITDSENLYNYIAEKGLKKTVEDVAGAMSLVWWDLEDRGLNFYRNSERPMYFVTFRDCLFFGSEPGIIMNALVTSRIIKEGDTMPACESLPTLTHISIDTATGSLMHYEDGLVEAAYNNNPYGNIWNSITGSYNYSSKKKKKKEKEKEKADNNIVPFKSDKTGQDKILSFYPKNKPYLFMPEYYDDASRTLFGEVGWVYMSSPYLQGYEGRDLDTHSVIYNVPPEAAELILEQGFSLLANSYGVIGGDTLYSVSANNSALSPVNVNDGNLKWRRSVKKIREYYRKANPKHLVFDVSKLDEEDGGTLNVNKSGETIIGACDICQQEDELIERTYDKGSPLLLCQFCDSYDKEVQA